MKKQYYDHRTVLCQGCDYHRPEGARPANSISGTEAWPEGCGLYGYLFHPDRYPEDAGDCEDCEGFETPERHARRIAMTRNKQNSKR